jgi:diaminohydroxyphosphoribosylaminopyrimidine deaminase/5-amino-6-(5-phosphoribosylamino)uracil reductase
MVGAVVVSGGAIIGEGYHARYGGDHAEVVALRAAGESARGATMYVTLEPCAHYGKTPPCVHAITRAGIARVGIAARDPSELASGGVERLRAAGVPVVTGLEQAAALELNAPFFNAHGSPLPWVTLKLALSADGAIAPPADSIAAAPRWITGKASRDHVHVLRAGSDAIAVGIGTVLADDPLLTVRDADPPRCPPRRVIFDSSLRIPLESALIQTARVAETILVAGPDADPARAAQLTAAGATILRAASLRDALRHLRRLGVRSLFVEGGARLAGALLSADLIDRVIIFQSPAELGRAALGAWDFAPPSFADRLATMPVIEQREFGDDTMTTYALHPIPCSPAS